MTTKHTCSHNFIWDIRQLPWNRFADNFMGSCPIYTVSSPKWKRSSTGAVWARAASLDFRNHFCDHGTLEMSYLRFVTLQLLSSISPERCILPRCRLILRLSITRVASLAVAYIVCTMCKRSGWRIRELLGASRDYECFRTLQIHQHS